VVKRRERGAVLLEFAILALVFYLLLSTVLAFGRVFVSAQVVQDAARLGALELSRTPLPAEYTFDEALADPAVRARVFDPDLLVVDLADIPEGTSFAEFFDAAPVLNRTLWPLMVVQQVGDRRLLHYPGALLPDDTAPSGFRVAIPLVEARDDDGVETIRWLEVVEEVRADPGVSPFSLNGTGAQRGIVALRINYPFQSAAFSGYRSAPEGPFEPSGANPIRARPGSVVQPESDTRETREDDGAVGPYAGPYGLGRQLALADELRPFRKLLSAQAVFRREVFE